MGRRKWWFVWLSMVLAFLNLDSFVSARSSLRGLQGVNVLVSLRSIGVPDRAQLEGLTKGILQTDTEQKLRTAGINILDHEEMRKTDGNPRLHVSVAVMKVNVEKGYICRISVELLQTVYLARDPSIFANVATWRNEVLGTPDSLHSIRAKVKDLLDRFITAYSSENAMHKEPHTGITTGEKQTATTRGIAIPNMLEIESPIEPPIQRQ